MDSNQALLVGGAGRETLLDLSLREMVELAIAAAEDRAIRRALASTKGNKSQAARLLRTNYTTLHAKMKRFGISAREFRVSGAVPARP